MDLAGAASRDRARQRGRLGLEVGDVGCIVLNVTLGHLPGRSNLGLVGVRDDRRLINAVENRKTTISITARGFAEVCPGAKAERHVRHRRTVDLLGQRECDRLR